MVLSRQRLAVSLVAFASLLACSDSTAPARTTVAAIEATGPSDTLGLTDTVRVSAVVRDGRGAAVPTAPVTWRSLHPLVATVNAAGVVTGKAAGNASIVATPQGRTDVADTVVVRVRPIPRTLVLAGLADSVQAVYEPDWPTYARDTAVATVRDAAGTTLAVPVRWSSSDTLVATVTATGVVTLHDAGIAWIRADAGRTAVDSVRVRGFTRRVAGPAQFTSFRVGQWGSAGPSLGNLSCGLSATGEAWCGTGATLATQIVPGGRVFSALALGDGSACALVAADGTLACWGANASAQLGIGATTPASVTTPVIAAGGRRFRAFDTGWGNTVCAIGATDSLAYCWGNNAIGGTGAPPFGIDSTVDAVPGLPKVLAVAVGQWHACAIVVDGSVWCWGDAFNFANVSGLGTTRFRAPAQITTPGGYVSIVATELGACLLDATGAVRCLMRATEGVGTVVRTVPAAAIPGASMRRLVGVRGGDTCGVSTSGALTCVLLSGYDPVANTLVTKTWLPGRTVLDASSSPYTLCATTDDHVARCW